MNTRKNIGILLSGLLLVTLVNIGTIFAHTAEKENLQVIHPWVEAALKGGNTTAHPTFMNNDEERSYTIIRAESNVSESVKFKSAGKLIGRIEIKPEDVLSDEDVILELHELKEDLVEGQVINLTLFFKDKSQLSFKVGVGASTMPE